MLINIILEKIALNNISFEVKKGEIFGLLGPNGAGKTTLIRLINKITNPNKGTIKFNNEYLSDKHLKKIGYLPEERGLYTSLSVEEHVIFLATLKGLTKSEAKESLNYWLNKFEISNWKNKKNRTTFQRDGAKSAIYLFGYSQSGTFNS